MNELSLFPETVTESIPESVPATFTKTDSITNKSRLLEHPDLWRAGQLPVQGRNLSSGFPQLDAHLPGNGWPKSGLSELLLPTAGIGELQLLMPLLRQLSQKMRWIAWINPPFLPYAPALEAAGVDISKILLIHPKSHKEALWALERASRSGTCSLALAWLDEQKLAFKDTRALQLAAKQGDTLTCLFRPPQAAQQSSMAELRLQLEVADSNTDTAERSELQVSVLKRRGGWPVNGLHLSLAGTGTGSGTQVDARGDRRQIGAQLSLWRRWRNTQRAAATADFPPGAPTPQASPPAPPQAPPQAKNVERHITH